MFDWEPIKFRGGFCYHKCDSELVGEYYLDVKHLNGETKGEYTIEIPKSLTTHCTLTIPHNGYDVYPSGISSLIDVIVKNNLTGGRKVVKIDHTLEVLESSAYTGADCNRSPINRNDFKFRIPFLTWYANEYHIYFDVSDLIMGDAKKIVSIRPYLKQHERLRAYFPNKWWGYNDEQKVWRVLKWADQLSWAKRQI